ncbi:hypothetical protein Dsin_006916 [Dipteronia sinensis]|uniref:Mal d 1-associated protein n=1 Tax=Dipteronia sinensis TaxID=43782 RepID=A0AAE0B0M5_9ROSI|nr:hypothetical protein Dsin_006916 [Dipteronia sinensis]
MGWVWRDDDSDAFNNSTAGDVNRFQNPIISSNTDQCSTRKVVRSQCKTEQVEPGKFIRKCEKTEEVFRDCIGKPVELLKSNTEYTEDDVTEQVVKGSNPSRSFVEPFDFPGLRGDIESIERHFLGGINRFFEAAEEMKNGFFDAFGHDRQSSSWPSMRRGVPIEGEGQSSSSPSMRQGVPIEGKPQMEASPKSVGAGIDFSGLVKDV